MSLPRRKVVSVQSHPKMGKVAVETARLVCGGVAIIAIGHVCLQTWRYGLITAWRKSLARKGSYTASIAHFWAMLQLARAKEALFVPELEAEEKAEQEKEEKGSIEDEEEEEEKEKANVVVDNAKATGRIVRREIALAHATNRLYGQYYRRTGEVHTPEKKLERFKRLQELRALASATASSSS